jgi:tetratricopeptide (TPR) repeat protein
MNKLVERLGHLPLALVQAGTYMRETKTGCSKYLDLYETSWSQLAAETPCLRDYENRSIQTTWMISYDRVRQGNPIAGKLLQLWAYLDHQDVWYELFFRGRDGWRECSWLQELASSEIHFKRVMKSLLAFSLIESHQHTESYSIHPVVHDWCAETISYGKGDLMVAALTIVGTASPDHSEVEYWLLQQRLLPHADRCVRRIDDSDVLDRLGSVESSLAFSHLGLLYADQGKHVEAEKTYRRALDGYEKAWGPDHTSTLDTVNNLGSLCASQGKHAEAEKMYRRALDGYEKAWGPDHTSTLDTVNNLGNLYADQGKHAEAEKLYRRALDGYEKAWGPDHISTLDIVNNLALLYADQGKHAEAEKMYRRALDGYEKAWGPDHTSTLNTVNNLGNLYASQGKHAEAEKMYRRALDGYEKAWGPDHTSTLNTVNNLGNLYADQDKHAEAEKLYRQALDGYKKAWGPDYISTLDIINNLALLYADQGKHAEAEKMYRRALDRKEKA